MPKPILVLAIGNESRGDDALGPLLARRLGDWMRAANMEGRVEIIEEFQLQIEHTLDIKDRELVLFLDAGQGTCAPFSFQEARAKRLDGHTSHAVAPETLLGIHAMVHDVTPPPAFILCVAGVAFELGAPLSSLAAQHFEEAFEFCQQLFSEPAPHPWREMTRISVNSEAQDEKS